MASFVKFIGELMVIIPLFIAFVCLGRYLSGQDAFITGCGLFCYSSLFCSFVVITLGFVCLVVYAMGGGREKLTSIS